MLHQFKAKNLREAAHWGLLGPEALNSACDRGCRVTRPWPAEALLSRWWPQPYADRDCSAAGLRLLPRGAAYGVHYFDWRWFYSPERREEVASGIEGSFAAHLWNSVRNYRTGIKFSREL